MRGPARLIVLASLGLCVLSFASQRPALAHDVGFGVARYNPDGSPDVTFNAGGLVSIRSNQQGFTNALVVQPDQRVVVAGVATDLASGVFGFGVVRFNPDGSPDFTFGSAGWVQTRIRDMDAEAHAVVLQSDGKIVVAGTAVGKDGNGDQAALARFNVDGSLDASFGIDGVVNTPVGRGGAEARGAALQADGKIVVVGTAFANGLTEDDFLVIRYNPDGSLDSGFGLGGVVTTDFGILDAGPEPSLDRANAVVLQSDGKIVVAGSSGGRGSEFGVARYNADGTTDASFGLEGRVRVGAGTNASALCIQPDSQIVVVGSAGAGSSGEPFAVVRLRADGGLDTNFGSRGIVTTTFDGGSSGARAVAIQSDNRIVVAGSGFGPAAIGADGQEVLNGGFALVRYEPDGSTDASFGLGGRVLTTLGDAGAIANALGMQPDGRIVAAGLVNFRVVTASAPATGE